MATAPDEIRQEIEATRSELAADVNRLADRTSPKRIAERRWDGMKSRVRRATDRVMGSTHHAGASMQSGMSTAQDRMHGAASTVADKAHGVADSAQGAASAMADRAQDAASSMADTARQAPTMVAQRTQGNPIAVGLIAFGAGLLAASLLPETEAERRAGERMAGQANQMMEPLKEKAQEMGGDLKERAAQAAGEVKDTAQQAMTATKEQATASGRDAMQQTKESVTH